MPKKIRETGNGAVVSGTNGDDLLNGLGGSYKLVGGNGNDTYVVDDLNDNVDEKRNGGMDHVISHIDWTLGDDVENLTLEEGTGALVGIGNELGNEIAGNSGANTLDGGDGDDRLHGGAGDDRLIGGAGSDLIDGGSGSDTAIFSGLLGTYSFAWSGGDLHVTNEVGETDILRNVEFLSFDGQLVAASDFGIGPQAVDDTATVLEDGSVVISVLDNDAGDVLSVDSATNGAIGFVTVNANGTITYTPAPNANGADSFSYSISDSLGHTATAWVSVDISPVNDAPVAFMDSYSAVANATFTSNGSVLDNDSDVDGDSLTIADFDAISDAGGTVVMNPDGNFSYTPLAGFTGNDSFAYTAGDGKGGTSTATVTISVAESIPDGAAPPYYVDALLIPEDQGRLNYPNDYGTGVTVTYTFLNSVPNYYSESSWVHNGFQAFSANQQQQTRDILAAISDFANINFVEVDLASDAVLAFGMADMGSTPGAAHMPSGDIAGTNDSDVWLNSTMTGDEFVPGSYMYYILLHELGHAIGMDHPTSAELPLEERNQQHTVMASNDPISLGYGPETYMLYDIATLQYIYGKNNESTSGNDYYTFVDFDRQLKTVWDANGHDTFDFSAATYSVDIDLRDGEFSTADPWGSNNIAIAFGTVIEDALGGAYDDIITGNEADNRLIGGGGSDVFAFADNWGNDTVTDFVRGDDLLDLSPAGLTFADLEITSSNGDTIISYADSSITLEGVNSIDESDFLVIA